MKFLVDSCILIDHLRGVQAATDFLESCGHAAISEITWIEVLVGARDQQSELPLRALLSSFERLPIDQEVSEEAVRARRELRLKIPDALILATARVHRLVLATRNTKDFDAGAGEIEVPYLCESR